MPCFKMKFFHFFSHSTPILGKGGSQPRPPTAASSATTIQVHQMARMVEGLLLQQPNRQRTAITSRSVIGISNAARSNEVSGNSFFGAKFEENDVYEQSKRLVLIFVVERLVLFSSLCDDSRWSVAICTGPHILNHCNSLQGTAMNESLPIN